MKNPIKEARAEARVVVLDYIYKNRAIMSFQEMADVLDMSVQNVINYYRIGRKEFGWEKKPRC